MKKLHYFIFFLFFIIFNSVDAMAAWQGKISDVEEYTDGGGSWGWFIVIFIVLLGLYNYFFERDK